MKFYFSSEIQIILYRPPFQDIAQSIRFLLDSLSQKLEILQRTSRSQYDILEQQKREFVRLSKQFSETLKGYFAERCDEKQSQVFNRLIICCLHHIKYLKY